MKAFQSCFNSSVLKYQTIWTTFQLYFDDQWTSKNVPTSVVRLLSCFPKHLFGKASLMLFSFYVFFAMFYFATYGLKNREQVPFFPFFAADGIARKSHQIAQYFSVSYFWYTLHFTDFNITENSTLRAKRATSTEWKMPKNGQFGEFLKTCSLQ